MYYHALKTSAELAVKEGSYETYDGSPVSKVLILHLEQKESPIFVIHVKSFFPFLK